MNVHPWPAAWKVENGTNINGVSNKNWEDLVYLFVVDGQRNLSTKQVTFFLKIIRNEVKQISHSKWFPLLTPEIRSKTCPWQ